MLCDTYILVTGRAVKKKFGLRGRDMMRASSVPKFDSLKKKRSWHRADVGSVRSRKVLLGGCFCLQFCLNSDPK